MSESFAPDVLDVKPAHGSCGHRLDGIFPWAVCQGATAVLVCSQQCAEAYKP